MFEDALKGTKVKKTKGWRAFGGKDANRWKKQGSPQSMRKMKKVKW